MEIVVVKDNSLREYDTGRGARLFTGLCDKPRAFRGNHVKGYGWTGADRCIAGLRYLPVW